MPTRSRPNGSTFGSETDAEIATGRVTPLIVSSPCSRSLVAEGDLREALGVEEVRRLEVAVELLVLDVDARDLGRALEDAVLQGGRVLAEAAAERVRAGVGDFERDVGVDRVGDPACRPVRSSVLRWWTLSNLLGYT